MQVIVKNEQRKRVRSMALRQLALKVLSSEAGVDNCELSILLCDDEKIAQLNAAYRGRRETTDVLAFPQDELSLFDKNISSTDQPPLMLGDVVISTDTALRQAEERKTSLHSELCLLLVHGILHLLGYSDEDPVARRRMLRQQRQLLRRFFQGQGGNFPGKSHDLGRKLIDSSVR